MRQIITQNLSWFLLSLLLAVLVWITAVSQSNPFEQRRVVGIPLRITHDPGLVITNEADLPSVASAQIVGQRNEISLLTTDDVVVTANLTGLGTGTHTVQLEGTAARGRVNTVIPSQITVELEVIASQLVPVEARIVGNPPPDIEADAPQFDVLQIEVSGPQSRVEQVVSAEVPVDLQDQRTNFEDDIRALAVDADGNVVSGVTLSPQVVRVVVPIAQSENVREVNVTPRPVGELPTGYFFTSFDYNPKTIYVSAPGDLVDEIPTTLFTMPIDLTGRTNDFQVTVPVDLEDTGLTPLSEANITVTVGIAAQTATRQIDGITVEQIGAREGLNYSLEPDLVSLIITAPQPVLESLTAEDVRVTADVSGLNAPGTYSVVPLATLTDASVSATIAILPAQIDVEVDIDGATPEVTAEP
jgi:YbbR domain-containing protein